MPALNSMSKTYWPSLGIFILMLAFGFHRAHLRMETTLIGYQLGELKTRESKLIEELNKHRLELAKISTKDSLMLLSKNTHSAPILGSYASK